MTKRKKKETHIGTTTKKPKLGEEPPSDKETRCRTIKHKLRAEETAKIQIRDYVENYHILRIQLYELISWMIEKDPTTIDYCCERNQLKQIAKFFFEGFDNSEYKLRGQHVADEKALMKEHQDDPEKLQEIKAYYDAIRAKGRATKDEVKYIFDEYKSIYPVMYVAKKYKNESLIMYMVTRVAVSVAEFYATDDHGALKAMTKKTYKHLWSLLWQYKNCKVLDREQHQVITSLGHHFYMLLEHFRNMITNSKQKIHRVYYLKTLEKITPLVVNRKTKEHKTKERNIRYGPRASFIPAHLTFEVSEYVKIWKNKWGFDHTFTTDGFSYCKLDKNIEVTITEVEKKEKVMNQTYDAYYGVDPGVKNPLQVATLADVTHYDTKEEVAHSNHHLNITQDEWNEYLCTEEYLQFVRRQEDRIRHYLNQLSVTKNGHEYRSILLRPRTLANITYCYAHPNFRQWRFRRYCLKLRRLEYVIQHFSERATKDQDIKWQDASREIEHVDKDRVVKALARRRQKQLRKERTKKPEKKVLLFWGNGSFGHTYKGNKTSSCHQIKNFIERKNDSKVKIQMVCERNTSNSCRVCKSKDLVRIYNERSRDEGLRLRRCNTCLSSGRPAFFERDCASAKFILDRGKSLWDASVRIDLV